MYWSWHQQKLSSFSFPGYTSTKFYAPACHSILQKTSFISIFWIKLVHRPLVTPLWQKSFSGVPLPVTQLLPVLLCTSSINSPTEFWTHLVVIWTKGRVLLWFFLLLVIAMTRDIFSYVGGLSFTSSHDMSLHWFFSDFSFASFLTLILYPVSLMMGEVLY